MTRQDIERRVVTALLDEVLKRGCSVSVFDGEEWVLRRSISKVAIMDTMFSTDMDTLTVRDGMGGRMGSFNLIYGNSGWDVVSDHTDNSFCNGVMEAIQPVIDRMERVNAR